MNIVSFFSTIAFVIYMILGIYVLAINIKSRTNILFFLMAICLAFLSFSSIFASTSEDRDIFFYWIKASVFFIILFFAFYLHFFIELTMNHKHKFVFVIILYLPVLFLIIKYTFSRELLYIDVARENNLWKYTFLNSFWTYLLYSYFALYMLISLFMLFIWGYKSTIKKIRRQSRIIFASLFLVLFISILDTFILPGIFPYKSLGIKHVLLLVWISSIFYSITRYRFLSFTPEFVSNFVISNINESIILLNNDLKIFFINKKTEELIGEEKKRIINKDLSEIILKYELIKNELDKMLKNQGNLSCRINFKGIEEPVLMDLKFSRVFDKFGDLIGILVIGSEVKELKQLKLFYKLSDREVEIVQFMIEGLSNKEIEEKTGLTKNTIKTHTKHIFNKLNVNSRIELINLLIEYDLIPRNSNSKKILLTKLNPM